MADHARAFTDTFRAITGPYGDGSGPFPERLHIGSATGRLFYLYAHCLAEWAHWAAEEVAQWPGTGNEAAATCGQRVQDENRDLAGLPRTGAASPVRLSSEG